MNDLKKLVAKANSSLSPRQKKSNSRYGLANFIAASTDQMLMTRGGYGATTLLSSCIHGSVGQCNRFPCNQKTWVDGGSDGNGSSGNGSSGGSQVDWQSYLQLAYGMSKFLSKKVSSFMLQDGKLGHSTRFIQRGDSIYDISTGISYPKFKP